MPTVLVTGGAGFIGSNLVDALLARGDTVRILDNFSTGKMDNLKGVIDKVELIEGDIRLPDDLQQALRDVDLVFHEAAFVSVPQSMEEPDICLDTNVQGTRQLLDLAKQAGVKRVVMASSAAVYGENPDLPLSEDAKPDPLSPYASSKWIGEIFSRLYTHQLGLEVVALRYFNVYGPRQNPASDYAAVVPIFIKKLADEETPVIYGDGKQSRDFVYVADIVRANLLAGSSSQAPGQVFNICSGIETSLLDLLEVLSGIFKRRIDPKFQAPRAGDIYRSLGDPSLAREKLEFQLKTGLEEGLQATSTWMMGYDHA